MPCAFQVGFTFVQLEEGGRCQFHLPEEELIRFQRKRWCRFHLPLAGKNGTPSEKAVWDAERTEGFHREISQLLDQALAEGKIANLTGVVFPGPVDLSRRKLPPVYFLQTVFSADAIFREVRFEGLARFDDSQFAGKVDFEAAQFCETANFDTVVFTGDASFARCRFGDYGIFTCAHFMRDATFRDSHFGRHPDFERCRSGRRRRFDTDGMVCGE